MRQLNNAIQQVPRSNIFHSPFCVFILVALLQNGTSHIYISHIYRTIYLCVYMCVYIYIYKSFYVQQILSAAF